MTSFTDYIKQAKEPDRILVVAPHEFCALGCESCYLHDIIAKAQKEGKTFDPPAWMKPEIMLGREKWKEAAQQLVKLPGENVLANVAGEALGFPESVKLCTDFADITEGTNTKFEIITGLYSFDKYRDEVLSWLDRGVQLSVSVDGLPGYEKEDTPPEHSNKHLRKDGIRVFNALEEIQKAGLSSQVSALIEVSKENLDHIQPLVDHLHGLGIKSAYIGQYKPVEPYSRTPLDKNWKALKPIRKVKVPDEMKVYYRADALDNSPPSALVPLIGKAIISKHAIMPTAALDELAIRANPKGELLPAVEALNREPLTIGTVDNIGEAFDKLPELVDSLGRLKPGVRDAYSR